MERHLKILAIVNPSPKAGGGVYRAKRSLMEYRRRGIRAAVLAPPIEHHMYNTSIIKELSRYGVEFAGFTKIVNDSFVSRRVRELLRVIAPSLAISVDLRRVPRDVDLVMSFHEGWECIWLAHRIGSELRVPTVAVLQLPEYYDLKHRIRAINYATKLYIDLVYMHDSAKKVLAYVYADYRKALDEIYSRNYRRILSKFDLIIGISKSICVETGLEESGRVHCMDPGVSFDEDELNLFEDIRVHFREKKNYIVFGGRPDRSKGIAEAVLAFKKIADRLGGYKLYVTGHLGEREAYRLRRLAKNLGVEDKIVFTGFVSREERLRIVREAKLMLYPSHVDSFSYAVAESLFLGTPVVAYDIPAIKIYYGGLEGVRLVRELDVVAMADEAVDILTSRHVEVEPPRLRSWSEIIEEEVKLIKRAVGG